MTKRDLLAMEAEDFLQKQAKHEAAFGGLLHEAHMAAALRRLQKKAEALLTEVHEAGHKEASACLGTVIAALEDAEEAVKEKK